MTPRITKRYTYVDEAGEPLLAVERVVPKGFRQLRYVNGEWSYGLGDTRRVLYRLPEVLKAKAEGRFIFLCCGEKDADAVRETGRVATTNPGGEGHWLPEFTETLRGCKVVLLVDNDTGSNGFKGQRAALKVACELDPVVEELRIYNPPEGVKDAYDLLKRDDGELKALRPFDRAAWQAVLAAQNGNGNGNGHRKLNIMTAKDFCERPGRGDEERLMGPMLWRGGRHVIGAHTGEGKTTMSCQVCFSFLSQEPFLRPDWRGTGGRVLYLNLEQGDERTKQRFVEAGLHTFDSMVLIHEPDGLALDRNPQECREVEKAIRDVRPDLVVFDPFYQLSEGDEVNQIEAKKMSRLVDGWARRYGFASLVPMHRRKPLGPVINHRQFSIHEIAGISTWLRNADVVLGLQVVSPGYSWLHYFKDRAGFLPPIGSHEALVFDRETHNFHRSEERDSARSRLKPLLAADPGITTQQLADDLGAAVSTVQTALRALKAHPEPGVPRTDPFCRWQLAAWPMAQTTIFEEE